MLNFGYGELKTLVSIKYIYIFLDIIWDPLGIIGPPVFNTLNFTHHQLSKLNIWSVSCSTCQANYCISWMLNVYTPTRHLIRNCILILSSSTCLSKHTLHLFIVTRQKQGKYIGLNYSSSNEKQNGTSRAAVTWSLYGLRKINGKTYMVN